MMPALASSSLYLPMAVSSSVLGFAPASESRLALTLLMNRMVVSLGTDVWCRYMVEWRGALSTSLSRLRRRLEIAELGGERSERRRAGEGGGRTGEYRGE